MTVSARHDGAPPLGEMGTRSSRPRLPANAWGRRTTDPTPEAVMAATEVAISRLARDLEVRSPPEPAVGWPCPAVRCCSWYRVISLLQKPGMPQCSFLFFLFFFSSNVNTPSYTSGEREMWMSRSIDSVPAQSVVKSSTLSSMLVVPSAVVPAFNRWSSFAFPVSYMSCDSLPPSPSPHTGFSRKTGTWPACS